MCRTALCPSGLVTRTSAEPAACAGVMAVIDVAEPLVTDALIPAKVTVVPGPPKPVPVIVTDVPPLVVPDVGLIAVMLGAGGGGGATNVNAAPLVADCPSVLVTVTSTAPAACAGEVTCREVAEPLDTVAGAPPNVTAVPGPPNPVPAIVTAVPPAAGPE